MLMYSNSSDNVKLYTKLTSNNARNKESFICIDVKDHSGDFDLHALSDIYPPPETKHYKCSNEMCNELDSSY